MRKGSPDGRVRHRRPGRQPPACRHPALLSRIGVVSAVDAAVAVAEPTACTAKARRVAGGMARARAPVAVAGRRACDQRRSRRRSGRRRTGAQRRPACGSRGASVVRPSDLLPPGPHRRDGHTLVFWHYLVQTGEVDPAAAGRGLRTIHDSLADYDGELPRAGRAEEVRAMLAPFHRPTSRTSLRARLARASGRQALHGDAHLFNCIQTSTGPIWHDLETACRGPREYDLAALVLRDRSRIRAGSSDGHRRLRAYDEDILEGAALPVYASWVAASFMVAVARRPDAAAALERQLRFLRRVVRA